MSKLRPTRSVDRAWQATTPGELGPLSDVVPAVSARRQPPLREVLRGLDARELEGETVFDQFFSLDQPPEPLPSRR